MAMGQNPVPPVNIPIPTKTGSKMSSEFTYPKMGSHWFQTMATWEPPLLQISSWQWLHGMFKAPTLGKPKRKQWDSQDEWPCFGIPLKGSSPPRGPVALRPWRRLGSHWRLVRGPATAPRRRGRPSRGWGGVVGGGGGVVASEQSPKSVGGCQ